MNNDLETLKLYVEVRDLIYAGKIKEWQIKEFVTDKSLKQILLEDVADYNATLEDF